MNEYIWSTEYDGKRRKLFPKVCPRCGKVFYLPKHRYEGQTYCSKLCVRPQQLVKLTCALCYRDFERPVSKLVNSKSGLHFCGRVCKDKAQQLSSGERFDDLRPDHYTTGISYYREIAFRLYPHKCLYCGYSKYIQVLEVHHKDRNRENNNPENLEIVCPTCHSEIHHGLLV